jgi:mannose-6-phosphate isomerase-like protein (cupin superfamily)
LEPEGVCTGRDGLAGHVGGLLRRAEDIDQFNLLGYVGQRAVDGFAEDLLGEGIDDAPSVLLHVRRHGVRCLRRCGTRPDDGNGPVGPEDLFDDVVGIDSSTMAELPMADVPSFRVADFPVHLGLGARVLPEAQFTGEPTWYQSYAERHVADGPEGRLVTMHTFSESWDSWEVHPLGEELVLCTEGTITLYQEIDGAVRVVTIRCGEAVINPPGVWHTADVTGSATALFITAGMGTENRPR